MNLHVSSISQCFVIVLILFLVSREYHTFLHYDDLSFSRLQRYGLDKASNFHVFHDLGSCPEGLSVQKLSFTDEDMDAEDKDNNYEGIEQFHWIVDKITL